ncbi:hypothetical protein [Lysinibacillus endophyticus]|uniref:hypothetical protein n=1 Tax=Ureibacillus endophyticus TaxID=1978490 RepID=UPI0031359148
MKKLPIFILLLLLLAGCKDQSVYNAYEVNNKEIAKEEANEKKVSANVMVHGYSGVANGYVIDSKSRKKWIVTLASSVSGHPNAIIVTSEGKEIEADVIGIDKEHNIAILYINNSAKITPYSLSDKSVEQNENEISKAQLDDEKRLQGIVSVIQKDGKFQEELVEAKVIKEAIAYAKKKPISYKERAELVAFFKDFPKVQKDANNRLHTTERASFSYNSDVLLIFIDNFHEALNTYFHTGESEIINDYIGSDDLKKHLVKVVKEDISKLQLTTSEVKSVNAVDYQYVVELETTINDKGEERTVSEIVKCILLNKEWKVISFTIQEQN